MYVFKHVKGHIEVYYDGKFLFSSDSMDEALNDIEEYEGTGAK